MEQEGQPRPKRFQRWRGLSGWLQVIIGLLGLAGIGGGSVVVVRAVASSSTTTSSTSSPSMPTTPPPPIPRISFLADFTATPNNADSAGPVTSETVGGQQPAHSVAVKRLFTNSCSDPTEVAYPSQGATTFKAILGWSNGTNAGADTTLTVHKNTSDGATLYTQRFNGVNPYRADFPLNGASTLVFVFSPVGSSNPICAGGSASGDNAFILGNAQLIK